MNTTRYEKNESAVTNILSGIQIRPGIIFGVIILSALVAFEIFNFSTTDYALRDLLGDLTFVGIHWATILSIAFCGIDFAGIARLFTPEQGSEEPKEVWYLFGAWFLAATMNAVLTWWGVSMAISNHALNSTSVVDPTTLTRVVPIFVSLMVWVIRILIIGSLSMAGEKMLGISRPAAARSTSYSTRSYATRMVDQPVAAQPAQSPAMSTPQRPSQQRAQQRPAYASPAQEERSVRPEPTYHSVNRSVHASGSNDRGNSNQRNF